MAGTGAWDRAGGGAAQTIGQPRQMCARPRPATGCREEQQHTARSVCGAWTCGQPCGGGQRGWSCCCRDTPQRTHGRCLGASAWAGGVAAADAGRRLAATAPALFWFSATGSPIGCWELRRAAAGSKATNGCIKPRQMTPARAVWQHEPPQFAPSSRIIPQNILPLHAATARAPPPPAIQSTTLHSITTTFAPCAVDLATTSAALARAATRCGPAARRALSSTAAARDGPYSLPALDFEYGALDPVISEQIMTLHHQKHHQTYVTNLNNAHAALQKATADQNTEEIVRLLGVIKFNGGGHVNHSIFWKNLATPKCNGGPGGVPPGGEMRLAAGLLPVLLGRLAD